LVDMTRLPGSALEQLARSSICRDMPPESVAALARHASLLDRVRGDRVYEEGAPAAALLLITRGVVKLVRALDSRDVIIELVGPGDVLGEAALTDGGRYDAGAVCVHPSTLLAIPRDDVLAFVASNADAVRNVLAFLHASLRRAHQRVEDLSVFGARHRIARLLLRLADWTGREDHGRVVVPLALSRQELAALIGTTRETTIRVMSGLRQEGLVEPGRRGVVLPDRAALELVAGESP
jgi:CRP-like cAMP-binding protein